MVQSFFKENRMNNNSFANINFEYYKVFYFVASTGSMTKASEILCLTQPAVSQSIRQLEKSIGTALFVRRSKGMELTTEGKVLFDYVKEGYEQIISGEAKVREMLGLTDGTIRIGASDMTLQFYLLPYLEKFHSEYPGINVSVTNAPTPSTIDHLKAGRIDFGVVSTPFSDIEGLDIYNGRKINDIFVAGSKFEELKGRKLSYKELLEYPIICLEQNTSTRHYIDSFLVDNGVKLEPEFELSTSSIVVQFAVRNLGIGCVVQDFAEEELKSGKLFKLEFDKEIPAREICVISNKKNPASKAAEALLELLK